MVAPKEEATEEESEVVDWKKFILDFMRERNVPCKQVVDSPRKCGWSNCAFLRKAMRPSEKKTWLADLLTIELRHDDPVWVYFSLYACRDNVRASFYFYGKNDYAIDESNGSIQAKNLCGGMQTCGFCPESEYITRQRRFFCPTCTQCNTTGAPARPQTRRLSRDDGASFECAECEEPCDPMARCCASIKCGAVFTGKRYHHDAIPSSDDDNNTGCE